MSKAPKLQKQKAAPIEAPEQDIHLGDLTPDYIKWHEAHHTEEEHRQRYQDRIPHDFAEKFGIKRV
jgi:hypothetical protein